MASGSLKEPIELGTGFGRDIGTGWLTDRAIYPNRGDVSPKLASHASLSWLPASSAPLRDGCTVSLLGRPGVACRGFFAVGGGCFRKMVVHQPELDVKNEGR